ncbi:hypothetical protein [Moorena sp. SIO3I6]|nr:hypothetical protein [Moorena sp. SIO3I6]
MRIFVPCSLLPTPYSQIRCSLFPDPLFPVPFGIYLLIFDYKK